jgi:transcription elongation factor GreA
MSDPVYLTRAGYEKLIADLEELKRQRIKISGAIEEARLQGDLSENAEYDAAKEAQGHNNSQIIRLEGKLSNVRIIEDQDIPDGKIFIGAFVTLLDLDTAEEMTYQMVSPEEANYEDNKLSIMAPIGKGLLGHAEGEELEIKVPAGVLRYKVLKIRRPK